jgi:hypothetical protein
LACHADIAEPDLSLCAQTYEFGNFGCGDVHGLVVNRNGIPVRDAYVNLLLAGASISGSPVGGYARTDSLGRFTMRATWMALTPANSTRPDSALVLVSAAIPTLPASSRGDSASVMAHFAAVGQRAPSVTVRTLVIPIP